MLEYELSSKTAQESNLSVLQFYRFKHGVHGNHSEMNVHCKGNVGQEHVPSIEYAIFFLF